jgi:hypothetical protein
MIDLSLLGVLLQRCKEEGLSLSFRYNPGHYITGDGEKGQREPGYEIEIGHFGHEGLFPSAYAAQVAGRGCLKAALEFDYGAFADELVAEIKAGKA